MRGQKMSELKRCPFCGGEAEIIYEDFEYDPDCMSLLYCRVKCLDCEAGTHWYKSDLAAARAWNRRVKDV